MRVIADRLPAKPLNDSCDLDVEWVSDRPQARTRPSCILDRLPALDVRRKHIILHGGEDGDDRTNLSSVKCCGEMVEDTGSDFIGLNDIPAVDNVERSPVETPDASRAMSPSHPRPEGYLFRRVFVPTESPEFSQRLGFPTPSQDIRKFVLAMKTTNERSGLLRLLSSAETA